MDSNVDVKEKPEVVENEMNLSQDYVVHQPPVEGPYRLLFCL